MKKKLGVKEIKKLVGTLLILGVVIASSGRLCEVRVEAAQYDVKDIISQIFDAVNSHDWDAFTSLVSREQKSFFQYYFSDEQLTNGVKQVTDAELESIYEVDNSLAHDEWLVEEYPILESNAEIFSVIVEVKCQVSKENQYFYNGINYFLLVLAAEGDGLKVVQFNRPSATLVCKIVEPALNKDSALFYEEQAGINVLQNADFGRVINSEGELLEDSFETVQAYDEDAVMPAYSETQEAILGKYTNYSCPVTITVLCKNDGSNSLHTLYFSEFVKNCLTNEWASDSGSTAYTVGAYCCKMDAWYKCIRPTSSSGGYDITTDHLNYRHGKDILSGANKAYDSINGKGMANSDKKIFFAHHGTGSRKAGNKASGLLWQEGSVYWEKQGKSVQWILDYYYKGSVYSSGSVYLFSY